MPSREPELYKDKIEVSLDGRQIFYLFFGGAVIAGLVFVLGVMVGRRVEARGHDADRADRLGRQAASDPLAALDRLERADNLSYHGALTGSDAPTDVEKAIGEIGKELDKHRAAGHDKPTTPPAVDGRAVHGDSGSRPEPARPDAEARANAHAEPAADRSHVDKRDGEKRDGEKRDGDRRDADKRDADRRDGEKRDGEKRDADRRDGEKRDGEKRDGEKRDADRRDGEKRDADKRPHKHDEGKTERPDSRKTASRDEPVTRPERSAAARADAAPDARDRSTEARDGKRDDRSESKPSKSEGKVRFTLQLSSFQDRAEAEAFLGSVKSAGFQAYMTEADVAGKGTFYRVRLGTYRSLEAANDAKAEYEKASRKTAQIMRL